MRRMIKQQTLSNTTKIIVSVIIFCLICKGCLETTTDIPITMALSTDSLSFPSSGGQKSFTVESNTNKWTVSSNVSSWLTFSPDSGQGNGSVTVAVAPYTGSIPKSATITVNGTGVPEKMINVTVSNETPTLSLVPSLLSIDAAGENKTFIVRSNISWTLTRGNDAARTWITLSRSYRTIRDSIAEIEITLMADANTGSSPREAKIAAYGTDVHVDTVYMTVSQAAGTYLDVSTTSMNFSSNSEQKDFTITSNTSWNIISNQSWCTVRPESGAENKIITVSVDGNPNVTPRQATLSITAGNLSKQITIIQESISSSEFSNGIVAASDYGSGRGSQILPFQIYNARQLKKLVDDSKSNTFVDIYFELKSNIHVTANEWSPIHDFRGHFDGGGYTISGTLKSSSYIYFGFFESLDSAHVSNLNITANVSNEGNFTSTSISSAYTGAIAGESLNVTISNCKITGAVTGGIAPSKNTGGVLGAGNESTVIKNCIVSGKISGGKSVGANGLSYTGGIVGRIMGEITDCTVSSAQIICGENDVTTYTGGIAGQNNNIINNCTNHAEVIGGSNVGGIVGSNWGVIHTSLNDGNVSGTVTTTGGLVGLNNNYNDVHIYDCCENRGFVNGSWANSNNQIGGEKGVEPCPDKHTQRN